MVSENEVNPSDEAGLRSDAQAAETSAAGSRDQVELRQFEEAVRRVTAELAKAQGLYQDLQRQAAQRLKQVKSKQVAEVVDETLELVRRHPGPGVLIAAMIGFFLGRLFRR